MKKVIIKEEENVIPINKVHEITAVFAKKNDILVGMIIKEKDGWILKIGGPCGANGHYSTREKCMYNGYKYGYEFFVE